MASAGGGGCSSCMGDSGYTTGESTRSGAATAAFIIRQVAALAIAVDNANELVKNYRNLRDIADRSLKISEAQQAQLQKTYWPREEQFLAEFGTPEAIEEIEVMGSRYAGRLVAQVAAGFAQQLHTHRCNAARYCTSAYRKVLQDLMQARSVALASARVLGRNIAFAEFQTRTDTNYNRRMQAVALGRGLMGEAAKLLQSASGGLAAAVADSGRQLESALSAFGQTRQEWRDYRAATAPGGGESARAPVFRSASGFDAGPNPMSAESSMAAFNSPGVAEVSSDLTTASGVPPTRYDNNPQSVFFGQQAQEQMNSGHVGDRDLVRVGTIQYPVAGVTGGTVTISMSDFGLGFADDKSATAAPGGGGTVMNPWE